jgi:hypothetical protein
MHGAQFAGPKVMQPSARLDTSGPDLPDDIFHRYTFLVEAALLVALPYGRSEPLASCGSFPRPTPGARRMALER